MYPFTALLSGLSFWLLMAPASAVTVLQCKDAEGNVSFQQRCPPGTQPVVTKKLHTGSEAAGAELNRLQEEKPVVLFRIKDCEACDQVSSYLRCRGVPFAEKDVSNDADIQQELITQTGELSVPVVTIGDEVVDGYSEKALKHHLDAAGYPGSNNSDSVSVQAVSQQR